MNIFRSIDKYENLFLFEARDSPGDCGSSKCAGKMCALRIQSVGGTVTQQMSMTRLAHHAHLLLKGNIACDVALFVDSKEWHWCHSLLSTFIVPTTHCQILMNAFGTK
jgi:hypothetical protein